MAGGDQHRARLAVGLGVVDQKAGADDALAVGLRLVDLDRRADHSHGQVREHAKYRLPTFASGLMHPNLGGVWAADGPATSSARELNGQRVRESTAS